MSYDQQSDAYAKEYIEKRRQEAAALSAARRKEIIAAVPEFSEIERERKAISLLKARAALSGDREQVESLTRGQEEIRLRLERTLQRYGYSPADLEEFHFCGECRDTGLRPDGSRCVCYRRAMRDHLISELNASSPLSLCSFDGFSLDYYSDQPDPAIGLSPRQIMKRNLDLSRRFASSFPNVKSLLMSGTCGLGKTHLALSIANELLQKDYFVLYCSAAGVCARIDGEKNDFSRVSDTLENMKKCDLLVLDDLGTEYLNNNVLSALYDLIDSRINEKRPTIITTNLTTNKLMAARYGDKITSRLYGCYRLMPFLGEDIRLKKNGFSKI